MSNPPKFRFSTGIYDAGAKDAPDFKWEYAVPVNDFWDAFLYSTACNFLVCFPRDEVNTMKLEDRGALKTSEKIDLLLDILQKRLDTNSTAPEPLWTANYTLWMNLLMAQSSLYQELGQIDEQIRVLEGIISKREDSSDRTLDYNLASLYLEKGDYDRAEEHMRPSVTWLESRVGRDSPQVLGGLRMLAKAAWKQGRRGEGEKTISEVSKRIKESGAGQYAVYQAEETKAVEELEAELRNSSLGV